MKGLKERSHHKVEPILIVAVEYVGEGFKILSQIMPVIFPVFFHYIKPRYEPRIRGKCKDLGALRVWGPEGKALPNCHSPIEATWWSLCHRPQYCHKWVVDALWTPRIWIDSTDWRREGTTLFTASNTELRKSQFFDLRWNFSDYAHPFSQIGCTWSTYINCLFRWPVSLSPKKENSRCVSSNLVAHILLGGATVVRNKSLRFVMTKELSKGARPVGSVRGSVYPLTWLGDPLFQGKI